MPACACIWSSGLWVKLCLAQHSLQGNNHHPNSQCGRRFPQNKSRAPWAYSFCTHPSLLLIFQSRLQPFQSTNSIPLLCHVIRRQRLPLSVNFFRQQWNHRSSSLALPPTPLRLSLKNPLTQPPVRSAGDTSASPRPSSPGSCLLILPASPQGHLPQESFSCSLV